MCWCYSCDRCSTASHIYAKMSIISVEVSLLHMLTEYNVSKTRRLLIMIFCIHTSNPCGLPRLSLICFHATRISDTDKLVALTSIGAAVGSVLRKMETISLHCNSVYSSKTLHVKLSFTSFILP